MTKLNAPRLFCCQNHFSRTAKGSLMEMRLLFEKAVAELNSINIKNCKETLIQLYSLYKQATEGDINIQPPGNPFDFAEKEKYDAWACLKGKSTKDAQKEYILLVHELKN